MNKKYRISSVKGQTLLYEIDDEYRNDPKTCQSMEELNHLLEKYGLRSFKESSKHTVFEVIDEQRFSLMLLEYSEVLFITPYDE